MSRFSSPVLSVSLIVLGVVIIAAGIVAIFTYMTPVERLTLDVHFSVGDKIVFDTNQSSLSFGKLLPGGSAQRLVRLRNEHSFPVSVRTSVASTIAPFLSFDAPELLHPYENVSVPVSVHVPTDISAGEYRGKILFDFRK